MFRRDIVVLGASAGGVATIRRLMSSLPADLDATVFVAMHRPPHPGQPDRLGEVLAFESPLRLRPAIDGHRFARGEIYVAPPDMHLIVERGVIRLERSPKESAARPSVDALFRSAALAYGRRVVGIVLTGMLSDGTVGLWQIRKRGGIAIAQDPSEAAYDGMPRSAIANVPVHYCLPIDEIGRKLGELTRSPDSEPGTSVRLMIVEDDRIVARDLRDRLRELGYSVVSSVATAEEAIKVASAVTPDLVLMDIALAGSMRGTQAAAIMWEQFQLPVVFLTAYSDQQTLEEVKSSAPFGFVVKPYRSEQLHAMIQLALDRYWREQDRLDAGDDL